MPAIAIDIENTAGTRQGAGPITSASNLKVVQRLSKAGTVSFDMPCADTKTADIIAKRVIRPRTLRNGAMVALPAGIVDSIAVRGRPPAPPELTISGDDILSELANRRVLGLDISDGTGGPVAIATALADIMALAPAGWTIDTTTYTDSGATVYHKFGDETVLAALIWVASAVGEQFRLGTGKQVVWLYQDQPTSGLRAIQTGDAVALAGNPAALLITTLDEVADTHTVVSRLYPYGAGNETARVSLVHATWTPPTGYSMDTVNNFIRHDASDTANRIEDVVTYNTIAEIGQAAADQVSASNQLAVAAYEDLKRRIVAVKTYRLGVTKIDADIKVGEWLPVAYRKTIDSYVAVNIAADLVVLEVATTYDAQGIASATLTVSTVDHPTTSGTVGAIQSLASSTAATSGNLQVAARALLADVATGTGLTAGSVPFIGASGVLSDDNAALFWNAANDSLYIGTNAPASGAPLVAVLNDALTATVGRGAVVGHNSSGTPAASFGVSLVFTLESSTTTDRLAGDAVISWVDATHATRKARVSLAAYDDVGTRREGLRIEANGAAATIGVLGANASARIAVTGSRGGNAALASLLTALATFGWITDSTTA